MNPVQWLQQPIPAMRYLWSRRDLFGGRWYYFEVFVWGLLGVAGIYFLSNHLISAFDNYFWSPEIALDSKIPAIPWMIIPYTSLYLLTPAAIALHPNSVRGKMELLLALQSVVALTAFHAIFFILFPADIALRDQLPADILAYEGFLGGMFEFIHTIDNPTNAWPSLHITLSYVICRIITIWLNRDYSETTWGRLLKWILWVNWVLLCISILTTKQHFTFDLVTGLILAFAWWRMIEPGFAAINSSSDAEIATLL